MYYVEMKFLNKLLTINKLKMKRVLLLLVLGLSTLTSCQDEELRQPSIEFCVYQWDLNENLLYVFGEYKLNIIQDGVLSFDGDYLLEDGLLTIWDEVGYSLTRPLELTSKGFLLDNMEQYVRIGDLDTYIK